MVLDISVLEEEPLVVFKFFKCCLQKRGPSEKRDGNCHGLADKMFFKVVGQPLGIAKSV
jgi:hypothetical protein